ncbi:MAG: LPS assembly lipoprotein LptE [Alphaproteobacteria bacterium]|nr:LPS assembly lipoprotein LptE [Alphaproteobacteria bacterium]
MKSLSCLLFVITALTASACGFSPIYGDYNRAQHAGGSFSTQLNQIDIALIPDREGQYLRNALIDRFYQSGLPAHPRYRLHIKKIEEKIFDFDVTVASEATRQQLKLSTVMELINKQSGEKLFSRALTAISSHNILESEFSTLVTEQSAREDALNDLARQIERQLAIYFSS